MRALLQRVKHASVSVEGTRVGAIEKGLLIFLGVGSQDGEDQAKALANKILQLRVFSKR
jgi:D-aminoacyl-tRNA deacylase